MSPRVLLVLDAEQVEDLRKSFLSFDKDNSGSLSLDEFRQAMKGKVSESDLVEIFQVFDFPLPMHTVP